MDQSTLIACLRDPDCYPDPVDAVQLIETHISYVLLTGRYAYKIKKAVRFDFVDFGSLDARKFYCGEELRLNRRLAPELYLDVVPIVRAGDRIRVGASGSVLEYAVRMREFEQSALLTEVLRRGELMPEVIDRLARRVASFHAQVARAPADSEFGRAESIHGQALANFDAVEKFTGERMDLARLNRLRGWVEQRYREIEDVLRGRQRDGHVRECHGDLHLRNVALIDHEPVVFDCIEFNPQLRWCDVLSEVAFTVMDLDAAGRRDLGIRFLNLYLEQTGDYAGLPTLRYYLVYRAMVRAKVSGLRALQAGIDPAEAAVQYERLAQYLRLSESYAQPMHPALIIAHGFSGSGKSLLTEHLATRIGAVRVRSDVERKRLHGLAPAARSGAKVGEALYAPEASRQTYETLLRAAAAIVASGYSAIVDATFLRFEQRDMFARWASEFHLPFAIVDLQVGVDELYRRVMLRAPRADEASEADAAVLERQLQTAEPLRDQEQRWVFEYDGGRPIEDAARIDVWQPLLEKLARGAP